MKRRLLKTLVAVLAIAAAAAGPVRGQNASPDVTLDFTSNTWGIPEGTEGKTAVENSYTSGGYTITLCGNSGNGYYFSLTEPYILLGKQGAYLQLPAFSSAVDSIHVVGTSVASTNVEQNIYVGETAVSTQTTGMKNVTQKYVINEDYRTAGTIYRIKVTSAHNTQIKKVLVYFAQAPAVPHTVRMAEGTVDAANWSIASGNASVPGTQVLENVMSGSQVTATYNGTTKKVKSVKAVKYVVPSTPLDNTMTAWADGRYAVPAGGLTYSAAITVSGDVTLVLTDGTTLTLNKGISLASGATLTVEGTGTMNVKGSNGNTSSTTGGSGTITLTSGTLTATGGNGQNGGDLETGAAGGAAINGSVIVDGGTLTATGGNGGNVGNDLWDGHGGAGGAAIGGSLTINAGTVTTTNGAAGSVGYDCDDCSGGAAGKAVAGTVTDNR